MAFSYKQRECETCGGKLEFDKDSNAYVCIYCGNRYERTESYDGQFSVRYAATQALSALLDVDSSLAHWDMVQTNLNDCQKIDPSYPGSIAAHLAASITRVRFLMSNREAVRTDLAQAQSDYAKLPRPFDPQQQDVEADFYDGLESSDIRSLLISVFNTFKDSERVSYIREGFHASDIRSEHAAGDLMNRAFSSGDYRQIDELLQSPAKLDADALFARILNEYPESSQKTDNISSVIMRGIDEQQSRDALSAYLESSQDSLETKLGIASCCVGRGIIPNGRALASFIGVAGDEASVLSILAAVKGGVLADEDVSAVVDALLKRVGSDTMIKGLNAMASAGYYLTFPVKSLVAMLSRDDLDTEEKAVAFRAICTIGLPGKRRQSVFADYLAVPADLDAKVQLIDLLAGQVEAINPMTVENYLIKSHIDGDGKPQVLAVVLNHVTARETLKIAAKRYAASNDDPEPLRTEVVKVLAQEGLVPSLGGSGGYSATRELKKAGMAVAPDALENYLNRVLGTPQYAPSMVSELYAPNMRITERTLVRFLLQAPDENAKASKVGRMISALEHTSDHIIATVSVDGHTVEAPILHAYLIANHDGVSTAQAIVPMLEQLEPKSNCKVICDGTAMRFRRLVQSGLIRIPDSTQDCCASIRLF